MGKPWSQYVAESTSRYHWRWMHTLAGNLPQRPNEDHGGHVDMVEPTRNEDDWQEGER